MGSKNKANCSEYSWDWFYWSDCIVCDCNVIVIQTHKLILIEHHMSANRAMWDFMDGMITLNIKPASSLLLFLTIKVLIFWKKSLRNEVGGSLTITVA